MAASNSYGVEASERDEIEFRSRVRLRLALPRLSRRLSLELDGNDDPFDDLDGFPFQSELDDAVERALDRPAVGLRYAVRAKPRENFSFSTGVRVQDPDVFVGARLRLDQPLGDAALGRFSQNLRFYADAGWEARTGLGFDYLLTEERLFRQRFDLRWREDQEDTEGVRASAITSVTRLLGPGRAIRYRWSTEYRTEPVAEVERTELAIAYRRFLGRPWIILQLSPFVAWQAEFDRRANPGLRVDFILRFEGEELTARPVFDDLPVR